MKKVTFVSRNVVKSFVQPTNVISIRCSDDTPVDFAVKHNLLLELAFDDVDGMMMEYAHLTYFNESMAEQIIAFVKATDGDILVHCQAGVSRSAAVAKFIHDHMGYDLDLSKPCLGTTECYNRRVYETLTMALEVPTLSAYYAELELADRMRGNPL